MRFQKLLIVDGSLIDTIGHQFEYVKSVFTAAKKRGLEVSVVCNKKASDVVKNSFASLPAFTANPQEQVISSKIFPALFKRLNSFAFIALFLRDWIREKLSRQMQAQTLVFYPTCKEADLFAFILLLEMGLIIEKVKVVCVMHDDPRFTMKYLKSAMTSLVNSKRLGIATDSESLSKAYGNITGLPVTTLPIPHTHGRETTTTGAVAKKKEPLRIVSLGPARIDKGIDVLANTIPLLENEMRTGKVEFVVQCTITKTSPELETAVKKLDELQKRFGDALELKNLSLSSSEYYELMHSAHAAILPYRTAYYAARTSGIMTELIAAGIPVIVTNGTWLAEQSEKHGAGILFKDGDAHDLARAVRLLIENYSQLSSQAEQKRIAWQEFHNADRLLDILLEEQQ